MKNMNMEIVGICEGTSVDIDYCPDTNIVEIYTVAPYNCSVPVCSIDKVALDKLITTLQHVQELMKTNKEI